MTSVVERTVIENDPQENLRNELWTVFTARNTDLRYKLDLSLRLKNPSPSEKIKERRGALMGLFLTNDLKGWEKDKLLIELASVYAMYGRVHKDTVDLSKLSSGARNLIEMYIKNGAFDSSAFERHTNSLWNGVQFHGEDKQVYVLSVLQSAYDKGKSEMHISNILSDITDKIKRNKYQAVVALGGIVTAGFLTNYVNKYGVATVFSGAPESIKKIAQDHTGELGAVIALAAGASYFGLSVPDIPARSDIVDKVKSALNSFEPVAKNLGLFALLTGVTKVVVDTVSSTYPSNEEVNRNIVAQEANMEGGALADWAKTYWDSFVFFVNPDNVLIMGQVNAVASRYKVSMIKSALRAFSEQKLSEAVAEDNEQECNADTMGVKDPNWNAFRSWCTPDNGECTALLKCLADYLNTGNKTHVATCVEALKKVSNPDAFKEIVKKTDPNLAYFILSAFGFQERMEEDSIAGQALKKMESVDEWARRNPTASTDSKMQALLHFLVQFTRCNLRDFGGQTEESVGLEKDARADKYGIPVDHVVMETLPEFVSVINSFDMNKMSIPHMHPSMFNMVGVLSGGGLPTESMTLKHNRGAGLLRAVVANVMDSLAKNGKRIGDAEKRKMNEKLDKLDNAQEDVVKTLRVYATYLNVTNELRDYLPERDVDSRKMQQLINRYKKDLQKIGRMEASMQKHLQYLSGHMHAHSHGHVY